MRDERGMGWDKCWGRVQWGKYREFGLSGGENLDISGFYQIIFSFIKSGSRRGHCINQGGQQLAETIKQDRVAYREQEREAAILEEGGAIPRRSS